FLLAVGINGCCFGGSTPPATITPPPIAPTPGVGAVPAVPAAAAQAVALGAGFTPDPTTVAVVAGGPVSGSTMGAADGWCAGNYPAAPQINLTLSAALPVFRVVGRATEDTTMAIRFPDGHVQCNDDGGGYPNPALDITNAAPGAYQVYIGSFSSMGQGVTSTVAFTTNPMLAPTGF
ncbi:MAG: hypothetical protein K1X94_33370, partial [Sandaracinaceae bacterium]|nr:hypothetical protein [Sandaracinaceae bacterium]